MRFGDLTYREIHECACSGWMAIVPTGCTEQQGPHLPVDIDTWLSEAVCLAASDRASTAASVKALVLPVLPFGPTPEHRNFGSGYIDLPQVVHEAVIGAVLRSLADQGFKRIVLWRGCGQHRFDKIVESFDDIYRGRVLIFTPQYPYHEIWMRLGNPANEGGHADAFLTSLVLYLRPQAVRRNLVTNPGSAPVDWQDPHLDFTRYTPTGVIGDPTEATAELGARLWEAIIEQVAVLLVQAAKTPV